jgi:hypothetical protein
MSNETIFQDDAGGKPSAMDGLKQTWDSFTTSSAYRTILLTGALLSSPKVRDFIGIPVCIAIFLLAWAAFTYETRFNYLVDEVTPKRQQALRGLREAKTQQLSSSSASGNGDNIQGLASQYEDALREELATRVIIPGLWVIEMDPAHEDRTAAPQLLGLEITDNYTLEPVD